MQLALGAREVGARRQETQRARGPRDALRAAEVVQRVDRKPIDAELAQDGLGRGGRHRAEARAEFVAFETHFSPNTVTSFWLGTYTLPLATSSVSKPLLLGHVPAFALKSKLVRFVAS